MWELDGIVYQTDQIQAWADEEGLTLEEYIANYGLNKKEESDDEELSYDRKPSAKYTEADIDAKINSKLEEIQKRKSEDETLKLIRAMIPDFGK